MNTYLQTIRLFNRNVRLYLFAVAMIGFSYLGIFVVLFNLYLLRLGYGASFIGAINAAGPLAFILISIPAGSFGRRWGSRQMIIAGFMLYIIGFGLMPFAEFMPSAWQAGWLFATYILAFLGGPLHWVNSTIYLMGATVQTQRNHVFSMRTALLPLAGFIGGLIAGLLPGLFARLFGLSLDDPTPYGFALWLGVLFYIPALLAMLFATDADDHQEHKSQRSWRLWPLALIVPLVLVEMLRMAGEVGTHLFYNVYLDDGLGVSTARIGLIVSSALLLAGLVTLAMPVLANRWGNGRTTILAMAGMSLFLLPLALIAHWLVAAIAFICFMALASISRSTLLVYRMGVVAPIWWAAMSGAAVTGQGVGETAFLFGGGFLIDTVGYKSFFLAAAGIILIGTLIFWIFHRSHHSKAVTSPVGIIE